MIEFKVVSGATNVLLLVNGKGIPAQVEKRDGNVLYRFIVRDDRLHEFFPERTCTMEEFDQDDYPVPDSVCGDGFQDEPSDTLERLALDMYREILEHDKKHPDEMPPADDERVMYGHRLEALGVEA